MQAQDWKNAIGRIRNGYFHVRRAKFYTGDNYHKLAEARALALFFKHYEVDCVFDVGANAGQYAQCLRANVGYRGHIISVEPVPDAFRLLEEKAKRDSKWHAVKIALSSEEGVQDFHVMRGNQFSSFLNPKADEYDGLASVNAVAQTIPVRTSTFNSFYAEWKNKLGFRRPYLKLDTQGYDHVILRSGETAARECTGVQAEIAFKRLYEGALNFGETFSLMQDMGFALSTIFPNNAGHFPDCIEQDVIFHNCAIKPMK